MKILKTTAALFLTCLVCPKTHSEQPITCAEHAEMQPSRKDAIFFYHFQDIVESNLLSTAARIAPYQSILKNLPDLASRLRKSTQYRVKIGHKDLILTRLFKDPDELITSLQTELLRITPSEPIENLSMQQILNYVYQEFPELEEYERSYEPFELHHPIFSLECTHHSNKYITHKAIRKKIPKEKLPPSYSADSEFNALIDAEDEHLNGEACLGHEREYPFGILNFDEHTNSAQDRHIKLFGHCQNKPAEVFIYNSDVPSEPMLRQEYALPKIYQKFTKRGQQQERDKLIISGVSADGETVAVNLTQFNDVDVYLNHMTIYVLKSGQIYEFPPEKNISSTRYSGQAGLSKNGSQVIISNGNSVLLYIYHSRKNRYILRGKHDITDLLPLSIVDGSMRMNDEGTGVFFKVMTLDPFHGYHEAFYEIHFAPDLVFTAESQPQASSLTKL